MVAFCRQHWTKGLRDRHGEVGDVQIFAVSNGGRGSELRTSLARKARRVIEISSNRLLRSRISRGIERPIYTTI